MSFDAKLVNVWPRGLLVDRDGNETEVRAEARTIVDGPVLDGVPRIPHGASLRIEALRCKCRRALVARRITVRR